MAEVHTHWNEVRTILAIGVPVVAVLAFIWAMLKWRIPMLSKAIDKLAKRVENLEKVSHEQDVNKETLVNFVRKEELYEPSGDTKYMLKGACGLNQEACQRLICKDIKVVGQQVERLEKKVDQMDNKREEARAELVAVQKDMVAVAQQMRDVVTQDRHADIKKLANLIVERINGEKK